MTTISDEMLAYEQAMHGLSALHHHGYSVVIHSPQTSGSGLYSVTAYKHRGKHMQRLSGSSTRLVAAIQRVVRQMSEAQMRDYVIHAFDQRRIGSQQASERAETVS